MVLSVASCTPPQPYAGCGNVGQQPNSDVGVWHIQAHQTDCGTARTLAGTVYRAGSASPHTVLAWRCTSGVPTGGLGSYVWCHGPAGAVVTWTSV